MENYIELRCNSKQKQLDGNKQDAEVYLCPTGRVILEGLLLNKLEQFRISLGDIENGRGLNRDFVLNNEIFGANGRIK